MGDAGTLSVLAQDTLTGTGVQAVTGAKTFNNQKLILRNPAGTKSLTLTNPTIVNDLPVQLNQYADFYIFIDIDDSNKIKAKENRTGAIKYNHATDAGVVFNSVIDDIVATTPTGGIIALGPGTFNVTTTITLKNYIKLIGSGYATILKLANSTNVDIIKTLNFATLTGTNSALGVHSFVLRDFVIDGNKTNNATACYGIRIFGYGYVIDNIIVHDCINDNIWSEWGLSLSAPSPHSMEAEWKTIKSYQAGARNITFRGPHDTRFFDIVTYRAGTESVAVESGATYSGGSEMTGCHFWGNTDATKSTLLVNGSNLSCYSVIAEGSSGTGGKGIEVTSGATIRGDVNVFSNETGLLLHSQNNDIKVTATGNTYGVVVDAAWNKITGWIQSNTIYGLNMSNYATLTDVTVDVHMRLNATHLNWAATHTKCDITAHIITAGTEVAVAGTIDKSRNKIRIYSEGAGTNFSNSETILVPAATEAQRFYRASNTAGDSIGTVYSLNDSAGNETTYAEIRGKIIDATDTSEDGGISFMTRAAGGSMTEKMLLSSTGALQLGTNLRLRFVETGLTAARVFSFPDGADDTVVTLSAAQTQTNKTFTAPIVTDPVLSTTIGSSTVFPTALAPYSTKKRGTFIGLGSTQSDGLLGANATLIAVGTGASGGISRVAGAGLAWRYTTGTTINSIGGVRFNSNIFSERDFNPWAQIRMRINQTANTRCFFGFTSSTAVPTSGADQLNALSGVMFGYDSGVDANWHIYQNDGTGASNSTTIANVAAAGTGIHTFALRADNANSKFQYSYDGAAWADINTDIPAASTGMGLTFQIENLTGSAMTMDVYYMEVIQDV